MKKMLNKNIKSPIILFGIIFIIFMSFIINNHFINNNSDSSMTSNQWIEDIDYLNNLLTENHPYLNKNSTNFNKEIGKLKNDLKILDDEQIKIRLTQIVASLGDGHTNIELVNNYDEVYPLYLRWYGSSLVVENSSLEYRDLIGKKVVEIANKPIKEVVDTINTLIPAESEMWVNYMNSVYIIQQKILKYLEIVENDKTTWKFQDDTGEFITRDISIKKNGSFEVETIEPYIAIKDKTDHDWYWYKYIDKDKILYFQYNVCYDKYTIGDNNADYPVFNDFLSEMKVLIDSSDIDKLVIDLRNNGGGDSRLITSFIEMIAKNDELNKKGKIFVIVGRKTFSGGVSAASDITTKLEAISIGEPTGGLVNCTGNTRRVALPNSKLTISYATKQFYFSSKYDDSFIPDIIVNQSIESSKKHIDDAYETIVKFHIKS